MQGDQSQKEPGEESLAQASETETRDQMSSVDGGAAGVGDSDNSSTQEGKQDPAVTEELASTTTADAAKDS